MELKLKSYTSTGGVWLTDNLLSHALDFAENRESQPLPDAT